MRLAAIAVSHPHFYTTMASGAGGWLGDVVHADAKSGLRRSAERYVAAPAGTFPPAHESERA